MSSLGDLSAMKAALQDSNDQDTAKRADGSGWDSRVPVNYELLNAKGEQARALEEAGSLPSWAHEAAKYEWDDEFGEVAPESKGLERELFNKDLLPTVGDAIHTLTEVSVTQEGPEKIQPVVSFDDAGLHPVSRDNLTKMAYEFPLPVQAYCIPAVLLGRDVIAVAQTGSGKTAAYLIPMLSKLMGKAKKLAGPRPHPMSWTPETAVRAEPLLLVICPTRELAIQIFNEARRVCYRTMLRPCCVYGGAPRRKQLVDLQHGCDVLIGTPGRLRDFITTESRWLSLKRLKATIFDEADEMLNDDWEAELKDVLTGGASQADDDHQYMMFSATFPKHARELARKYLADDHIRIRVGRPGSTHANIYQSIIFTDDDKKTQCLYDLLISMPPCRTLIFVNSHAKCEQLDSFLYRQDLPVTSVYALKNQREREEAMRDFQTGKCPIMVSSGITGRGLDFKNVMHVINYDLPSSTHGGITEYVHRIGRTARIGNRGQATSFYNERNSDIAESLVKILMECSQDVPDFLEEFRPADGQVTWDDDTDDEGEADANDGGWGTSGGVGAANDGWGTTGAGVNSNDNSNVDTWGNGNNTWGNGSNTWGNGSSNAAW